MIRFMTLFLIFLSIKAQANECPEFSERWLNCKIDTDCVIAKNACGGWQAYNASYIKEIEAYNICTAPMILQKTMNLG